MVKQKILLLLLLFSFCTGCDGIIMSKRVVRSNGPIDGTSLSGSRFKKNDIRYAQGNLKYLNNRKTRDNSIYFASINEYNTIDYKIAKDYINNYQKFLKVDPDELEYMLKVEQYGKKNKDISRMMEAGVLPKHPVENNIRTIQLLNEEDNKMAFPDYISEYLDVNRKNDNSKTDMYAFNDDYEKKADYDTENIQKYNRDSYIDVYLKSSAGNYNQFAEIYKEKSL